MTTRKSAVSTVKATRFFIVGTDPDGYGEDAVHIVGPSPSLEEAQRHMERYIDDQCELENIQAWSFTAFEVVSATELNGIATGVKFTAGKKLF